MILLSSAVIIPQWRSRLVTELVHLALSVTFGMPKFWDCRYRPVWAGRKGRGETLSIDRVGATPSRPAQRKETPPRVGACKKNWGEERDFCHVFIAYVPAVCLGSMKLLRGGVGECEVRHGNESCRGGAFRVDTTARGNTRRFGPSPPPSFYCLLLCFCFCFCFFPLFSLTPDAPQER